MRPGAVVEAIPLDHDPVAGDVFGDRVGRRRGHWRLDPFRVRIHGRRHDTNGDRDAGVEVSQRLREPDRQSVAVRQDTGCRLGLAREHGLRTDDVAQIRRVRRP